MTAQLSPPSRFQTISRHARVPAAAIGAAALVGIGAFGVTSNHSAATSISAPEPTGQTIIQTTPPREPATPVAKPTVIPHRFIGGDWPKGSS
jgi:hypothetical protein